MTDTRSLLATLLSQAAEDAGATLSTDEARDLLTEPPRREMGDIAFPCFVLSKQLRTSPAAIATTLCDAIAGAVSDAPALGGVNAAGPYLNFTVDSAYHAAGVLRAATDEGYGRGSEGEGQTIGIDFSSPNIAKPFGIGHLRSTSIGNALGNIFRMLGYRVVGINHLGDWGTQFGKLMFAYESWGNEEALVKDPITHLYDLYVRFHKAAEEDETLLDEGRAWFKRLEDGDEQATAYWQRFRDLSLREFERIYERLGVSFEHYWGEAYYNDMLAPLVEDLDRAGLTEVSDGAVVVDMSELDMPPCLIVKADGATLYATRDLAAARYRYEQLQFKQFLYIVGAEQTVHFRQVFEVLRRMNYSWAEDCHHIPFGRIHGISTRKGTLVFLDDILNKGKERVAEIMADKPFSDQERELITEQVTVGAVLFYDLSRNRIKNYDFDWDLMLRGLRPGESGQTGPYLQYTHTRLASLERQYIETHGELPDPAAVDYALLGEDAARALITHIEKFPELLRHAARDYEPAQVSRYAIEIAELFNSFYSGGHKVVSEDRALSAARITLANATRRTLATSLGLLGVPLPARM